MSLKNKKEKIDFKYDLGIYFGFVKKYLPLFIIILLIGLLIEASFTSVKLFFKVIIDRATEFSSGDLGRDEFVAFLITIGAVYLSLVLLRSVMKWVHIHLIIRFSSSLIVKLKKKYFDHLLHLSHDFHTTHKSGSLISRLTRGGHAIDVMSDVIIFEFTPLIFQIIISGIAISYFSYIPAIVILLVVAAFIGFSLFIQNKQQTYNLRMNKAEDSEKGFISDVFTNIDSIKYYGKEEIIKKRYRFRANKSRLAHIFNWSYFRWWNLGHSIIIGLGAFFVLFFSLRSFLNGTMKIGTVVFIFTTYAEIITLLFFFVFGIRNFYRAMADFDSLFQYGKIKNNVRNHPFAHKLQVEKGGIEFRNVSFKYHKHTLFRDFNLTIQPNEKVALVGHSGCGKTSIVKLLYRLYDVQGGEILIDGSNIKHVQKESLRSEMAIVPQECILFDDTIYNNIAFSNPGAKDAQIRAAMRFAQLDRIIERLPEKEKTIVGERGVKLSGGEKQRVSIARAILADTNILVLDEATSALDSRTEFEIQRDLEKLLKGRTAIIIAHRLSTIMNADRVIVIDQGRIVQMGKHNELIIEQGPYKRLWDLQKDGYIAC